MTNRPTSLANEARNLLRLGCNNYRLIALVQYAEGALMIRFFGSHEEYDGIDAETV